MIELIFYGLLSIVFWLLFKACEHVLLHKMLK